jgi:hypothetical protein
MPETESRKETGPEADKTSGESANPKAGEHQNDGRYIPYSGGSLGWFENAGVPAAEKRNNYQYYTAMDAGTVRAKQYLRSGLLAEKRRAARRNVNGKLFVAVKSAQEDKSLRIMDISTHGMRLQYVGDDIALKTSDRVLCRFLDTPDGPTLLALTSTIVWSEKSGKTRALWNFGIDFPLMAEEQLARLKEIGGLGSEDE